MESQELARLLKAAFRRVVDSHFNSTTAPIIPDFIRATPVAKGPENFPLFNDKLCYAYAKPEFCGE